MAGALGTLSTGNLTSVLNTLSSNPAGLANTLSTLGAGNLNSLLTGSVAAGNLHGSPDADSNLGAVTGVLGALTPAALSALTASLPAGFLGALTGTAVAATKLSGGADLADGSIVTCGGCACEDADQVATRQHIVDDYKATDEFITAAVRSENMEWILEDFFKTYFVRALKMMTEQLVTNGMNQMMAVGAILDAKTQLETQRLFQQKTGRGA